MIPLIIGVGIVATSLIVSYKVGKEVGVESKPKVIVPMSAIVSTILMFVGEGIAKAFGYSLYTYLFGEDFIKYISNIF